MKTEKGRILLFFILWINSFSTRADSGHVIPLEGAIGGFILFLIGGFVISLILSLIIKSLLELLRKEKRKHIWLMATLTLIFPTVFWYVEDEFHILYKIEANYSFEHRQIIWWLLIIGLTLAGSVLGYYITQKKKAKLPTT
jgi:hypothetical protein